MATLFLNRSSSTCGSCNKEAFPTEDGHFTIAGYYLARGPAKAGCGEKWTAVSSNYSDIIKHLTKTSGLIIAGNLVGLPVLDYSGNVIGKYASEGTFDELL